MQGGRDIIRGVAARAARLARDRRGVSAVEFALLLPLMIGLYVAGTELSQGIAIARKVTLTTRAVTDLVSRVTSTSTSDLQNSLGAAAAVVAPYATAPLSVTVSQIKIDNSGNATIDWSCSYQGTAHQTGDAVTLPASMVSPSTYLIWGESQYNFTPRIGYVISGTLRLKDQAYMVPRLSKNVGFSPANCPSFS
jgi:Flp pilus assembly protein TadG